MYDQSCSFQAWVSEELHAAGHIRELADFFEKCLEINEACPDEASVQQIFVRESAAWILTVSPHPEQWDGALAEELITELQRTYSERYQGGYRLLGLAHLRQQKWQESIDAIMKSIELREADSERAPANGMEWFPLALAHWHLGNKQQARKWYGKGAGWMDSESAKPDRFNQRESRKWELQRLQAEAKELISGF